MSLASCMQRPACRGLHAGLAAMLCDGDGEQQPELASTSTAATERQCISADKAGGRAAADSAAADGGAAAVGAAADGAFAAAANDASQLPLHRHHARAYRTLVPESLGERELRARGFTSAATLSALAAERRAGRLALDALVRDASMSGADKMHARVEFLQKYGRVLAGCRRCFLLSEFCVCGRVGKLPPELQPKHTSVVVHYHFDEFKRGSNTGCLLELCLDAATALVRGYRDHDAALDALLRGQGGDGDSGSSSSLGEEERTTVAVLWPGVGALTPDQLRARAAERSGGRITLIALDATYTGARRMWGRYPPGVARLEVPREYALAGATFSAAEAGAAASSSSPPPSSLSSPPPPPPDGARSLFAPARRYEQSAAGRVSTLEAVAGALLALDEGGGGNGGNGRALHAALLRALKLKVDAVRRQGARAAVYDVD